MESIMEIEVAEKVQKSYAISRSVLLSLKKKVHL